MLKDSENYDLVLVVEYFRAATAYLSIIKGLVPEYSIGIYQVPLSSYDAGKNDTAQKMFLKECEVLGAKLITTNTINTSVLLVPQRPLSKDIISTLCSEINAKSTILLLGFAYPGIKVQDEILSNLKFKKAYAIDKDFINFLAKNRAVSDVYDAIDIVEVGLPFKDYPLFEKFSADYILAMPTLFSFANETDKWSFLESVKNIFKLLDVKDVVVHKPHNGLERNQFSSSKFRIMLKVLNYIPGFLFLIKLIAVYAPVLNIKKFFSKLVTAHLYEAVLERTVTMEAAGGFSHFALEAYLPHVRKGVIGGGSNAMWGTLFFKLPFYNCVDILNQDKIGKNKLYGGENCDNLLELNLQYFLVPYCAGKLSFDESLWNIPSKGARSGNLINELKQEIMKVRSKV